MKPQMTYICSTDKLTSHVRVDRSAEKTTNARLKPQELSFLKSEGQIIVILEIKITTEQISLASKYSHCT